MNAILMPESTVAPVPSTATPDTLTLVTPRKRRTGSAVPLVRTTDLSRDAWLQVRRGGIGGSDAAAAVGLNPYKSQLELWLEKTGRDEHLPQPDPHDMSSPMYWATALESLVAHQYSHQTGRQVRRVNAVLQHPQEPWMIVNLDREVIGSPEVQILECKTAGLNGARLWRDGVPEYVQLQVMHQLAVTGHQAADVAVLICGQEMQVHRIERDETMIAQLIELERQFWGWVERDQPPPADGSESAATALQCLYPRDSGQRLDLSTDPELGAVFDELVALRHTLDAGAQRESELRQRLQQRMGDASLAVFATGEISWKRSKDSIRLDVDRLLQDQPELLQRYSQTRPGSRRFLVRT